MEIMGEFEGMFREYEPLEVGWGLVPKTVSVVAGLIGSEWILAQAQKYIEWFETAEVAVAKIVIGIGLILGAKWLKLTGFFGGLIKAVGVGCLIGALYTYIVEKFGEQIGIATLPFSGLKEKRTKKKASEKKKLYL